MKHFLIKYRLPNGSQDAWHQDITEFISALDSDPALQGKISYRCMKSGADYYHLATAVDDQAIKALQARVGGAVDVLPLEIIAETKRTS